MSDLQVPPEFEEHVGFAVDPIPASPARKRAMREELLAHLRGAYEQELLDGNSTQTALAAAKNRFGNLDLVRDQLRHSVPLLERLTFQFLAPMEPLMIRWTLVGIAFFLFGLSIVLPALAHIRDHKEITTDAVVHLSIGLAIVLIGMAFSAYKIIKRFSQDRAAAPR